MLDTRMKKPLFVQLYDEIRQQIDDGSLPPGDRLPAERELAELNGISRDTARKAVQLLGEKGYVYSWHGKGAYVLPREKHTSNPIVTGYSEELQRQGIRVTSKTLLCEVINADKEMRTAFEDARLQRIIHLGRLRLVDGVPVAFNRVYLRHPLCAGIRHVDLSRRSLYAVLEEELGIRLVNSQDYDTQISVSQYELDLLQVKYSDALILKQRKTWDDDQQIVEVVDAICRIDYWRPKKR